jgi:DNA mismatch repair ATPase MutS
MRFLGFLFLVAVGIGAWGWWKDWFSVTTSDANGKSSITVEIDKDKLAADLDAYEKKAREVLDALDRKIDELKEKAKSAGGDAKKELEREIDELEQKKEAAAESLGELKNSSDQKLDDVRKRLDEVLEESKDAVKRAGGD